MSASPSPAERPTWSFATANVTTLRPQKEDQLGVASLRRFELSAAFHAARVDFVGVQGSRCSGSAVRSTTHYIMYGTAVEPIGPGGQRANSCELWVHRRPELPQESVLVLLTEPRALLARVNLGSASILILVAHGLPSSHL